MCYPADAQHRDDAATIVDMICNRELRSAVRLHALERLQRTAQLEDRQIARLNALLPGGDDAFTMDLVRSLSRVGNQDTLRVLLKNQLVYEEGRLLLTVN